MLIPNLSVGVTCLGGGDIKLRQLVFQILRCDSVTPEVVPRLQTYILPEMPGMTLFVALNLIRENQDPSLMFDFVCRAGICGSCGILVNGKPRLACKTLTSTLPASITLLPLPVFKLIGDLAVDTGVWFRHLSLKTRAWLHTERVFDPGAREEPMDNRLAQRIYEAERCIECGCCIAGCATANLRPDFPGAAGLNRIARYMVDPRDGRSDYHFYELVGSEEGIFACYGLMACEDNCPVGLPLQSQLAYVRRKLTMAGLRGKRGFSKW